MADIFVTREGERERERGERERREREREEREREERERERERERRERGERERERKERKERERERFIHIINTTYILHHQSSHLMYLFVLLLPPLFLSLSLSPLLLPSSVSQLPPVSH